jgi:hypothetical protein
VAEIEPYLFSRRIVGRFSVQEDHSQQVELACGHRLRFAMPIPPELESARCGICAADYALAAPKK